MGHWRLYWQVTETHGRFEVVGAGVARPEQPIPEDAMGIACSGGKEESIWLYRAVRIQLTGRSFASHQEASQAVLSLLGELQRAGG